MHLSANINPNTAKKEFAMPHALFGMSVRPEPAPGKNHINAAILASVQAAATAFDAASASRCTLKDIVRLLANFDHFRALCVSDLKNAFYEQRKAQTANLRVKAQGKKTSPNRIVRNRKSSWETLFGYFAQQARLDSDVEISADGHRGDYTCELKEKKKRESELDKAIRICKEHGLRVLPSDRSADEAAVTENMADPDQQHGVASEPGAMDAAIEIIDTPLRDVLPDGMSTHANDAQQTIGSMPASAPIEIPAQRETSEAPPLSKTTSIHPIAHQHGAIPMTGTTTLPREEHTPNEKAFLQAAHAAAQERERAARERRTAWPRHMQDFLQTDAWEECLWLADHVRIGEEQTESLYVDAHRRGEIKATGTTEEIESATMDRIMQAVYAAAGERERVIDERRTAYPPEVQDLLETDELEESLWAMEKAGMDMAKLEASFVDAHWRKLAMQEKPAKEKGK